MLNDYEGKLQMETHMEAAIEFIGVVRLPLGSSNGLILNNVFYVPTIRRILIFIPEQMWILFRFRMA